MFLVLVEIPIFVAVATVVMTVVVTVVAVVVIRVFTIFVTVNFVSLCTRVMWLAVSQVIVVGFTISLVV